MSFDLLGIKFRQLKTYVKSPWAELEYAWKLRSVTHTWEVWWFMQARRQKFNSMQKRNYNSIFPLSDIAHMGDLAYITKSVNVLLCLSQVATYHTCTYIVNSQFAVILSHASPIQVELGGGLVVSCLVNSLSTPRTWVCFNYSISWIKHETDSFSFYLFSLIIIIRKRERSRLCFLPFLRPYILSGSPQPRPTTFDWMNHIKKNCEFLWRNKMNNKKIRSIEIVSRYDGYSP